MKNRRILIIFSIVLIIGIIGRKIIKDERTSLVNKNFSPNNVIVDHKEIVDNNNIVDHKEVADTEKVLKKTDPEYWTSKVDDSKDLLLSTEEIYNFNRGNFANYEKLLNLFNLPNSINYDKLNKIIKDISIVPKEIRYKGDNSVYSIEDYNQLNSNLNMDSITDENNLKYGLSINRTFMKTFPTYDASLRKQGDLEFDRFMETAIYPLEPLVIYLESKDGKWYFASAYNYTGWIPKDHVAIGDKDEIFQMINKKDFLVVIDRQIVLDEIIYDMGVKIPLIESKKDSYRIYLPYKQENEKLMFYEKEIKETDSFNVGYLPYTKENLIKQAFKFYSEPYGWGGMNNSRDCSAFILDTHRSFGFQLPRNASEQGFHSLGHVYEFSSEELEERLEAMDNIKIGTALYMPGHVMLYLGKDGNEHYAIHQYAGHYENINNALVYKKAMKTDITSINIKNSSGKTYLETLYIAKEFK